MAAGSSESVDGTRTSALSANFNTMYYAHVYTSNEPGARTSADSTTEGSLAPRPIDHEPHASNATSSASSQGRSACAECDKCIESLKKVTRRLRECRQRDATPASAAAVVQYMESLLLRSHALAKNHAMCGMGRLTSELIDCIAAWIIYSTAQWRGERVGNWQGPRGAIQPCSTGAYERALMRPDVVFALEASPFLIHHDALYKRTDLPNNDSLGRMVSDLFHLLVQETSQRAAQALPSTVEQAMSPFVATLAFAPRVLLRCVAIHAPTQIYGTYNSNVVRVLSAFQRSGPVPVHMLRDVMDRRSWHRVRAFLSCCVAACARESTDALWLPPDCVEIVVRHRIDNIVRDNLRYVAKEICDYCLSYRKPLRPFTT